MSRNQSMRRLALVGSALALLCSCKRAEHDPSPPKVLLIGVDAFEWKVIEPLVSAGRMPHMARLMAHGSYGNLETLEPILSPIIWTTIATGREPDEHGITWFLERDAETGKSRPISSRQRETRALWNIASDAGLSVGVVGWWATWPAEKVNGWVISDHVAAHGFGLSSRQIETDLGRTYPQGLYRRIEPLFVRPSQITDSELRSFMPLTEEELATRRGDEMVFSNPLHHFVFALSAHKTYAALGRYMLAQLDPALGLIYFEAPDSVSHLFMKYADPPLEGLDPHLQQKFENVVPRFYERQDQVLGSLLEAAGEDTNVVIVSDHGFKTKERRLREVENTRVEQAHLWHEKEGVVLMSGPAIRQGVRLQARVQDVAPTVLYLLGLPVAQDMSGRVLIEAVRDEHLADHPVESVPSYESTKPKGEGQPEATPAAEAAAELDEQLVERLAALGYIDTGVTPEVLQNRAQIAIRRGKLQEAASTVDELLAADPGNLKAKVLRAELSERGGRWSDAAEHWRELINVSDEALRLTARRGYARSLIKTGRFEKALKTLAPLLRAEPSAVDLYHLGLAREGAGQLAAALDAYERAIASRPQYAEALNNAGSVLLQLDEQQRAASYFRKSADADPNHAESRHNLAILLLSAGREKEAVDLLEAAVRADPRFVPSRLLLADRLLRAGQSTRAKALLEQVTEIDPSNKRASRLLEQLEDQSAKPRDAVNASEAAPPSRDMR